jgi:ABC-2 type transport system permease protein
MVDELRQVWHYRDLLMQLISRNIKVRYKRSVLGIAWTMLNPLFIMIILSLVFSNLFRGAIDRYPVYILSALVVWNFFGQTTTMAMSELVWGGSLFHRIYVPRTIFSLSAVGTGIVNLLFALVPLAIIMLATGIAFTPAFVFVPLAILLTAMFALGVGLILSVLAAQFADVVEAYQIVLTAWMYLTPVIYPLEIIPEQYRWLFNFNPMYHFVQIFRLPFYEGNFPGWFHLAVAAVVAVTILAIGWGWFTHQADEIAYRI